MEAEHSDRPTDRDTNLCARALSPDRHVQSIMLLAVALLPLTLHVAPALIPTQRTCLSTYSMMAKKSLQAKACLARQSLVVEALEQLRRRHLL